MLRNVFTIEGIFDSVMCQSVNLKSVMNQMQYVKQFFLFAIFLMWQSNVWAMSLCDDAFEVEEPTNIVAGLSQNIETANHKSLTVPTLEELNLHGDDYELDCCGTGCGACCSFSIRLTPSNINQKLTLFYVKPMLENNQPLSAHNSPLFRPPIA